MFTFKFSGLYFEPPDPGAPGHTDATRDFPRSDAAVAALGWRSALVSNEAVLTKVCPRIYNRWRHVLPTVLDCVCAPLARALCCGRSER